MPKLLKDSCLIYVQINCKAAWNLYLIVNLLGLYHETQVIASLEKQKAVITLNWLFHLSPLTGLGQSSFLYFISPQKEKLAVFTFNQVLILK